MIVKTACSPKEDEIALYAKSDLIKEGRIQVFFDFPYGDEKYFADYVGDWAKPESHLTKPIFKDFRPNVDKFQYIIFERRVDDFHYFFKLAAKNIEQFAMDGENAHR